MKTAILVIGLALGLLAAPAAARDRVDYLRDVKPLLAGRCYACHGPLKQESGLRLDTAALAARGGEIGPAVVAGSAAGSLLVDVVTGDAGFRMPPEDDGAPLSEAEIELLRNWIDQGAEAPEDEQPLEDPRNHWSYQPPVRPAVQDAAWGRHPIDAFVAAEHDRRGLQPRPAADKHVWLRRVYLDLIGLPPTGRQLQAFLADTSEGAHEVVVDQLLNSPQYGERWGRHWMDVWRYSDWYGSRGSDEIRYSQRHIWRWRDWIIESLNADKGYDRMILEMLAGDELAPSDPEVLRATGFVGRNWYKFDRHVWLRECVEHTAMGLLASTLKCARCHDHKFEPISQQEYYRFRAFFEPHEVRTDVVDGQLDPLKDGLARVYDAQLDAPTYLFLRGDDRRPDQQHPLTPGVPEALGGELKIQPVTLPLDAYYPVEQSLAQARAAVQTADEELVKAREAAAVAERQVAELAAAEAAGPSAESLTAESWLDEDFTETQPEFWQTIRGQWEYRQGRLVQTQVGHFATLVSLQDHPPDFQARVRYKTTEGGQFRSVGLFFDMVEERDAQAVYTSANDASPSVQAFHRQDGRETYPPAGIVPCPIQVDEEVTLQIEVRGRRLKIWVNGQMKLDYHTPLARQPGRFALWVHNGTAEFLEASLEPLAPTSEGALQVQLEAEAAAVGAEKNQRLADAEFAALEAAIAAQRAHDAGAADADELVRQAGEAQHRAAIAKAERNWLQAQQQRDAAGQRSQAGGSDAEAAVAQAEAAASAARQALESARQAEPRYTPLEPVYPRTSSGRRLALARWIVDPQNPRTARVAVNHMWLRHFGVALVPAVANFGASGKSPSHPKLLDWLAQELVESGWSMKHLHRLMVTSSAYRMASSIGDPDHSNLAIDPDNRYLWRMNWRRMEAEVVRDSLLHVAGRLDLTQGGPELAETLGQESRRRSLYFRSTPNESMEFLELFDLANPDECYERKESVAPQQALALTNSALALTQARWLARELSQLDDAAAPQAAEERFVTAAFERILSRGPSEEERVRCRRFLREHTVLLEQSQSLSALPAGPQTGLPPAEDPALRARENLVHVLLNHNEFLTLR